MRDMGWWRGFIAAALLLLAAGSLAAQDVYIETSVEAPAPPGGQAPRQGLVKLWSSGDKIRVEPNPNSAAILRKDLGKQWIVNNASKTYMEQPLVPPADAATEAMMSAANMQVDLKATGNTKKIGEWNCQEYVMTLSAPVPMVTQIWACPDVKIDTASFYDKMSGGPVRNPMIGPVIEKIKTIPGFPIQTVSKVMMGTQAMENTMTVQKISLEKIDPALFELPAGYTKRELPAGPTPGAAPAAPSAPTAPTPKKGSS